jgi:hypothetical protein
VTNGRRGAFAGTCFDIHLREDGHTLQATCATDGSLARFRYQSVIDLDSNVGSFDGQLEAVLYCTPTADGPIEHVPCTFSRSCDGVKVVVDDPAQFEADGTARKSWTAAVWLLATCPAVNGTRVHNRLNLDPFITNRRGRLEWACNK